jgi:hypothetical protein
MMAKRGKPTVRRTKSRSGGDARGARALMNDAGPGDAATPPAGPTQAQLKTAVDGALAEKIKGLFFELYNGVTTGEPKPNPKAAADRFASNIQSARATYEIAIKAIG